MPWQRDGLRSPAWLHGSQPAWNKGSYQPGCHLSFHRRFRYQKRRQAPGNRGNHLFRRQPASPRSFRNSHIDAHIIALVQKAGLFTVDRQRAWNHAHDAHCQMFSSNPAGIALRLGPCGTGGSQVTKEDRTLAHSETM
ncbi:uncharacterized protein LOC120841749 isoform X1 [Ixodes scapularis]|uniref:uncharacterized protein LOC120841749 isoform X1 n=1 Tax=Ixodes scapularis TaxID=6945 RepID=UPI001A9E5032|nr:uncharacterized protein LOC120841749 isoform X1 [Ixodes scapularis]